MTTTDMQLLRDRLHGELVLPADVGYDDTRRVWNAMVDRRPRMIIRCANVDDVITAVRAGQELGLEIGVRCGGHNIVGLAVPHDGLMIDLTPMGSVRVDPDRRRAWVQGGVLLGALDEATQPYGLATTAGNVSHTGVGGLTLGGGMGWLARKYGLTCDNALSFQMVTASGDVVRASETENPELFWGLRGGGGNFGVVTEFEFQLHPIGNQALVAELLFPINEAPTVFRDWQNLALEAPREATFTSGVFADDAASVGFVWVGDPEQGRHLISSLRGLGNPIEERVVELSYLELQRREDTAAAQHALRRYWKGHYLGELTDAAIAAFVSRGGRDDGAALPAVSLQTYGGAIADVPDDATAFSQRDARFEFVTATRWVDPAEDASRMATARRCAAAVEPFATGAYVNSLSDEGREGVGRAYSPAKLARLTALKDVYDPTNVFHLNYNIRPSAPASAQTPPQ